VKRSFAVSSIVHIAFLTLVVAPGFHKVHYPGSEVISVKLVAEEKPAPKTEVKVAPPKEEKPVAKKDPAKPKMAYKSPTKKRTTKAKKASTPQKTPSKAKTADTAASTGKGGSKSKVRVDDKDFRFAYYLEILRERISDNWSPPPVTGSQDGVTSTVYFKISRDGRVSDVKIETSSKSEIFDRSTTRAVDLSSPLPPLPAGFKGRWLGVHFEFEQMSG
jgi:TonB family protein